MPDPAQQQMQQAARCLLLTPLLCAEHQPELFAIIRRHEQTLDRWFTQRLGYRLQVSSSTARLFKSTVLPHRRTLVTATQSRRPLTRIEYSYLVLTLAAVAAGPRVISLHDLINDIRSAATDAGIELGNEAADRRALVTALKWMLKAGLVSELHEHVGRYEHDAGADAILEVDPERIALLPLSALGHAETANQLLDRSDRRASLRQWLRARLVEDPVLYRDDLEDEEWSTLRRRLGEEGGLLDEMFGLELESRAEGVAAIDPQGELSDHTFPATGTVSHAALLLLDELVRADGSMDRTTMQECLDKLCREHKKHWSKSHTENTAMLLTQVLNQLQDMRLISVAGDLIQALPAAARYSVVASAEEDAVASVESNVHATARANGRAANRRSRGEQPDDSDADDLQQSLW